MSGCGCGASRSDARSVALPVPHWTRDRMMPERFVRIEAQRTFSGTNRPVFAQDGEAIVRQAQIQAYYIDPFAVTNDWFRDFVEETGHVTDAERYGWSFVFLGVGKAHIRAAVAPWWGRIDGARWDVPEGPGSGLSGRGRHPVTHVSWNDAQAFATWAGGRLPSEIEWETAARGGDADAQYPWGNEEPDDLDFNPCNIWQGEFPNSNTAVDGFASTAPVDQFAANAFGLHNMVGNVWEWTAEPFKVHSLRREAKIRNAAASREKDKLMKGGSFLCHKSYCWRYRIAARSSAAADTSIAHVGFRVVFDAPRSVAASQLPMVRPSTRTR
ncbi:hypothetical protein AGRO_5199 [Agrobacterium sp. ATCC 31749]|nr:hypothetical protein AGRO_5199 [Agrobacterium sp. ATCC 31749]QKX00474.1 SUMF1/EgtB/PvdO family nonheme iron enzyme [Agrobacterium sp. CGMCC 11546]